MRVSKEHLSLKINLKKKHHKSGGFYWSPFIVNAVKCKSYKRLRDRKRLRSVKKGDFVGPFL